MSSVHISVFTFFLTYMKDVVLSLATESFRRMDESEVGVLQPEALMPQALAFWEFLQPGMRTC